MAGDIDQQKMAMLNTIADQGSQGAQRLAAQQAAFDASKANAAQQTYARIAAAPSAAPPPSPLGAQLTQGSALIGDTYAQDAARAAQTLGNEYNRMSQANSIYMDQVNAAIPVIQARAQALAQQAAEKRAYEREMRAQDMQNAKDAAEIRRQSNDVELQKLDLQRQQIEQQKKEMEGRGTILSFDEAAKTLGYNPDLVRYISGNGAGTEPGIAVPTGKPDPNDPSKPGYDHINPYQSIFSAGEQAASQKGATWRDVENAMRIQESKLAATAGHGWNNELNLALTQFKPAFGQPVTTPSPGGGFSNIASANPDAVKGIEAVASAYQQSAAPAPAPEPAQQAPAPAPQAPAPAPRTVSYQEARQPSGQPAFRFPWEPDPNAGVQVEQPDLRATLVAQAQQQAAAQQDIVNRQTAAGGKIVQDIPQGAKIQGNFIVDWQGQPIGMVLGGGSYLLYAGH